MSAKKKNVTITEVAEQAKTSISTVSRVFNDLPVAFDLRERVLKTAEKLQYVPNVFAQGIRGKKRGCYALILSKEKGTLENPWTQKIIFYILQACSEEGYHLMLELWDPHDKPIIIPELIRQKRVDGCILLGHYPNEFYEKMEKEFNIPLIAYTERMPYSGGMSVNVKNREGMKRGIEYLFALGHRKIGMVSSDQRFPSCRERYEGFKEAMKEFHAEIDDKTVVIEIEKTGFEAGYKGTEQILTCNPRVTAIVYNNDFMALGGLEALKTNGLKVPEDVSVMGWDNLDIGSLIKPSLTTNAPDPLELSRALITQLDRLVHKKNVRENTLEVGVDLIKRESTGVQTKFQITKSK